MSIGIIVIATVMLGTSGDSSGMVSYATSIAQLSIGITLISLLDFGELWLTLKKETDLKPIVNLRSM